MVRCFERLEMHGSGEAWWPPLVESLPAVLTREVAWSWRLDTRPVVDRDALKRLVIVCCDVMHWSAASRPSRPVSTHRRGDQTIVHTATDAQLTGWPKPDKPVTRGNKHGRTYSAVREGAILFHLAVVS